MILLRHTRVNQEYKCDLKKEMLFFSNVRKSYWLLYVSYRILK